MNTPPEYDPGSFDHPQCRCVWKPIKPHISRAYQRALNIVRGVPVVLAALAMAACSAAPLTEPPAPVTCTQVGGITNDRHTIAVLECDGEPEPLPGGWCKPAESGWSCCYPSVPGGCAR